MRSRLWHTSVVAAVVLGLVLLWFRQPVATTFVVPFAAGIAWSLAAVWRWTVAEEGGPPPRTPSFTKVGTVTTAALGAFGLMLFHAGLGLLTWCVLGLCSPPVRRRLLPVWAPPPETRAPAPDQDDVGPDVRELMASLSDGELCRAWRRSFVLLHQSEPEERLPVVVLRAAFLDEMTRRHPREVETWLASGGRAAGGPDRFFSGSE